VQTKSCRAAPCSQESRLSNVESQATSQGLGKFVTRALPFIPFILFITFIVSTVPVIRVLFVAFLDLTIFVLRTPPMTTEPGNGHELCLLMGAALSARNRTHPSLALFEVATPALHLGKRLTTHRHMRTCVIAGNTQADGEVRYRSPSTNRQGVISAFTVYCMETFGTNPSLTM
jgi:hypothetical protein